MPDRPHTTSLGFAGPRPSSRSLANPNSTNRWPGQCHCVLTSGSERLRRHVQEARSPPGVLTSLARTPLGQYPGPACLGVAGLKWREEFDCGTAVLLCSCLGNVVSGLSHAVPEVPLFGLNLCSFVQGMPKAHSDSRRCETPHVSWNFRACSVGCRDAQGHCNECRNA